MIEDLLAQLKSIAQGELTGDAAKTILRDADAMRDVLSTAYLDARDRFLGVAVSDEPLA